MTERFAYHPGAMPGMNTEELRAAFAITDVMEAGALHLTYSHYDRMVIGGAVPLSAPLELGTYGPLQSTFFLERRELGIINTAGSGRVRAGGNTYPMDKLDCLYLGRGTAEVTFESEVAEQPARFFLLSAPAHQAYPARLMKNSEATPAALGAAATSNARTIYKYIHQEGIRSCQLVMGLTVLQEGSVWNTMPAHTHHRRMEVYLYFDLPADQRVFHFMGQPHETRHLLLGAGEAVLSPPWSIHAGCGTSSYSFIWGMAGENQSFSDMDFVAITDLR